MTFYKYTSIPTAKLMLENETVRWSSPVVFNDIEECQFVPFTEEAISSAYKKYQEILINCAAGTSPSEYESYTDVTKMIVGLLRVTRGSGAMSAEHLAEMMEKVSGNLGQNYREFVNAALVRCFRVMCLTTEHDNALMWAHYADQHRGCVLELEEFFRSEPRGFRRGFVRYHENLEPTSDPLKILLYGETKEATDSLINDVVFSKRTSWGYEKEYRLLFNESFGEITTKVDMATNQRTIATRYQSEIPYTDVAFCPKSIKSIAFGARAGRNEIECLSKMLVEKRRDIGLYRMEMRDGRLLRADLPL
jgi:hypothetical protein